jgi:uncharacterized RDD family membrane protein YckC
MKYYAGFWVRIFASLLDSLFLMPLFFALIFLFGFDDFEAIKLSSQAGSYNYTKASGSDELANFLCWAFSIAYAIYFLTSKMQATLGKRVLGIYVGNRDGSKLSWKRALARFFASVVTGLTFGIGFFMLVFTKEKIALHDLICNTRVFHGKK